MHYMPQPTQTFSLGAGLELDVIGMQIPVLTATEKMRIFD
jgi:hypothetical protein